MNQEKVIIRKAKLTDAEIIHNIHTMSVKGLCNNSYSNFEITNWLKNRTPDGYKSAIINNEMYLAEYNNTVVGFGHAITGEIVANFVLPEYSGLGIGKKLLEYGLQIASKGSEKIILTATANAIEFYEKFGFIKIREYKLVRNEAKLNVADMELTLNY